MPFKNKSEATKRSKDRKQTTNVQMARTVGVVFVYSIYRSTEEFGELEALFFAKTIS